MNTAAPNQRTTHIKASNYDRAFDILGSNDFIPPKRIIIARGLTYSPKCLAEFGETLPDEESLMWCRDNGMMLTAGPPSPMSLLTVRSVRADYFFSRKGGRYSDKGQKFARDEKVESTWISFRKEPGANSLNKCWKEQSKLVKDPMDVPKAVEVAWCITTYKAVHGTYLLPELYVRTRSVDSGDDHVLVGAFDTGGLSISYIEDDRVSLYVGLSGCRKF